MRLAWIPSLLALAAIAGCGGGDGSDDTTTGDTQPGGDLFTQTTHKGTLSPIAGRDDVFKLTFAEASPDVTVFTDRPVRSASTEEMADFVSQWDARGFANDPPNAALVLDQEPDDADTAVFTLADPTYDQASGAVTYTATHVGGGTSSLPSDEHIDPPPTFGDAHLFIDPSGGGDQHDVAVSMSNNEHPTQFVTITFDAPWEVFLASDDQEISYLVGPNPGGGHLQASNVKLGPGGLEFHVQGGTGPITGTATFQSSSDVTVSLDDGPEQTLKSGKFSLSP
ncbi:MAG TPA: hypothetical protein VH329_01740 [Solirubrobacterales bacterium]|jgi:hypothetical protein